MKVLVLGAGNMGAAFVKQLVLAGHDVSVASRSGDKAQALAAAHPGARAVPASHAAVGADVIILATAYPDAADALRSVGDLTGKTVIDISNPLTADYMGLTLGHATSAAEEIAKAVPQARLVKGFNTLFAQVLAQGADFGEGRHATVFLAGDHADAKQTATALAVSMGFEAVDAGQLHNARYLEPLAGLNVYLGYGAGRGTAIAPTWIARAA
ncbi:MAG: NAD(P)-binding domain-containing protein [Pseudomonadota bacterium]